MGGHGGWVQSSGFFPNGLLPNESTSVTQMLDPDRWSQAEERTAELIARIQPNQPSEERRQAVASYVQRLITKCFSCQVFTFGSVPLKTYLPDGDIDLTTFSKNHNLKDNWANEVQDMLKREEKSEDAEFRVKEVQYIQAEVKIIKCLVENIVVDISFNQLGGLCTLCFLEEVNHLISQNHLFKRSVILIKAWCYYESRILGAHHGLISTYALETLVLYIFHVYNNSFSGPLEVLYRFLEFFSKFDWENFCVSLWGPVPICSLPDMTGKPPRKDGGKLLLTKKFLNDCSSVYAVFPGGLENQEQPFVSKHFNVIDPLRTNNNLGRSVSKGNFFRIRSAFAFGAQRLARLLDCPKENLLAEVNQFFSNTWDRHGKGHRPDAPSLEVYASRGLNMSQIGGFDLLRNDSNSKAKEKGDSYDSEADLAHLCQGLSAQHINHSIQKSRTDNIGNKLHDIYQFARTHSSPELTDPCTEILSRGRHNGAMEAGKGQTACTGLDNSKRRNSKPEASLSCNTELSNGSIDASNTYYGESGLHCRGKEHLSVAETMQMHQEAQDLVNMMASSTGHSFNGQVHVPVNLASVHPTHPLQPSILPSLGYAHRNPNIPSFESSWMHYTQDLVSLAGSQYFPYLGMTSYREELAGTGESNLVPTELKSDDNHHGFYDHSNINSRTRQLEDMHQFTSSSSENSPYKDLGDKYENNSLHQRNRETDVYTTTSSSSVPSQVSSSRISPSSASNMDGLTPKSLKPTRDRRGLKAVPSTDPSVYVSESIDHTSSQADHDNQEWVSLSTIGTEVPGYESSPLCSPRLLGSASGQKAKDSNVNLPFTFYPTGPPIPFLTMLPLYNLPTETGIATASTNHFDKDEDNNNFHKSKLDHGLDLTEKLGQAIFNRSGSVNGAAFVESSECKSQILNGDFTSHWQNLQYGRLCQNAQQHGSFLYPTINAVPPVYMKEQFLYDGLGKPPSSNVDLLTQLLSYSPSLIPISSLQPSSIGPAGVYQPYGEEIPRYRAGTGTYLPNPKFSSKDRHQSSHSRNHRGNNGYDRKDHHGDREGNWNNTNTKPSRFTSRGQGRNQSEKPSTRTDRSTSSSNSRFNKPFQPDPFPSYQSRNGSFGYSNSTNHGSSGSSGYGMYQLPLVNPALISVSGTSLPYDQNVSYISPADLLDLGSLRAMQFSGLNEGSRLGEGSSGVVNDQWNYVGGSAHSSPDHPSSTEHHRKA